VDWYREDMNGGGPLPTWQNNDATNRQGITENFYVQNHLAYWDALLAMNPGLRIDCCGSGGRRNDLEAMQRAVPLTRSDFEAADLPDVVDGNQCQTYGLSSWLPFQGTGCYVYDPYSFRSFYMASFIMGAGLTPENTAAQQQAYAECKRVAPILLNGDYYPLTPYSLTNTVWMAWQFDWPDTGQGVVQVFRRTNSPVPSMVFTLQGLNPTQQYAVQDFDKGNLGWHSGLDLMSNGLSVQLNPEQSAILYYTNAHGVILSATANPASGFAPLAVQFDATGLSASGAPVSYRWNFGDGGTSTNQNPIYTYETAGRYVAELTAGDGQGDTNTVGVSVTVASVAGQIMNINFSGYTESEPLTNFPALVILGTNLSTNGFSYSQVASSNGWDLLFLNSNKTQLLNYEIEKWDANGDSYVWVQVPLLASNSCIWASWGNARLASMPSASTQNGSVWTNGYAGVWHLANGSVLSATDSTTNDNDGIIYNATPVEGVIDGAGQFNGEDSYVDLGTPTNARAYQQVTMSAWVYPIGGTVVLMAGNDDTPQSYGLEWSGNSSLLFSFANTTDWLGDGGFTPPNQWSFVTGVINGNTKLLYVDGILRASKTFAGILSGNPLSLWLGAQNRPSYNYWFEGILDEARISSMARSSNWIGAEYMTVASNQTVNAYGAVTSYNPPTLSLVSWTTGGNGIGLVLSWPTNVVGLELQMSRDLVHWTNSTATVTLSDTDYTVTVTNESTAQFYRLAGY
jgi:alpha-galactosidase